MSARQKQAAAAFILLSGGQEKVGKRCWERKWISKRQQKVGFFRELMNELREEDPSSYENFLRMSFVNWKALLEMVSPIIKKQDTKMRKSIPPEERLALTLRFLATGTNEYIF
jgi:hypothetical protein